MIIKNIQKEKIVISTAIPAICMMLIPLRKYIIELGELLPHCGFNRHTGLLCPACGNTRSIISLLHGDVMSSLRYNITPIILLFITLLLYIENVIGCFGITVRLIPRKISCLVVLLIMMSGYYITRNFIPYLNAFN